MPEPDNYKDYYTKELKKNLGQISSIKEINISFNEIGEKIIEFELYIPKRIQEELSSFKKEEIDTEKFGIIIQDSFHGPVTFVEPINSKDLDNPSFAVQVTREFLRREFEKYSSSNMEFTCIGPSPFHAEFIVVHDKPFVDD